MWSMASKLDPLFAFLDRLTARPDLGELVTVLRRLDVTPADLAEHVRFSPRSYQRNLVRAGDWYHVWVMCWRNGQRSPIHDHTGSVCAVRVLAGTATVTQFAFAPNGQVKALGSEECEPGSVVATADGDLHQVSNLQAGDADLVTLHVYCPPLLRMGTYSILDASRGEDVWGEERRVVTSFPENSETPLESVHGWVTPNRLFFVRNHFATPSIDRPRWRLRVGGLVDRPVELRLDDLQAMPQRSVFATVECAGNGRSFLRERQPGVQWGAGAIGHAEWTGVPVSAVLERAGLRPGAVEVLFEGADRGSEADHPEPMNFARSLPMSKALDRDTLLVLRMNGELLIADHGAPLRLFVPGWYGVASVKWLSRLEVLAQPFRGYYQSVKYTVQRRDGAGRPQAVVVGPMQVKAEIIRPVEAEALGIGTNRVFGIAWAGEEAVGRVEVSTDGGETWGEADLLGEPARYCWTLWEYLWEVAQPGRYDLLSRAVSAGGKVQPTEHDALNGGYLIHHSRPRPVRVAAGQYATAGHADLSTLLYDMNAFAEESARLPLDVELEFSGGAGI
jgi:DMSO/TMAO reductase YedYZ molybdopterin-dependent catalytic subunit